MQEPNCLSRRLFCWPIVFARDAVNVGYCGHYGTVTPSHSNSDGKRRQRGSMCVLAGSGECESPSAVPYAKGGNHGESYRGSRMTEYLVA